MATVSYETCPTSAPFFGFMGVTAALCFASKSHVSVLMFCRMLLCWSTWHEVLICLLLWIVAGNTRRAIQFDRLS
jgi:hypothetical protein